MTEPTLIAMRGLPASGKTTAALAWVADDPEGRARVGRDPLRDALYGTRKGLTNEQEVQVSRVQREAVRLLLKAGKNVVVDDMNLKRKYLKVWVNIAAEAGAKFSLLDVETDVEECVKRDGNRVNAVGEEVIRDLHRRFRKRPAAPESDRLQPTPYVPDGSKPQAWIFDIDGTLATNNHGRSFYATDESLELDDPRPAVVTLLRELSVAGYEILVCTGRSDLGEVPTCVWLDKNVGREMWDELFMRHEGDQRPDAQMKLEIFDTYIRNNYNVIGVIDDRNSVVSMWRDLGLICLQAAPGDF